MTVEVHFTDFGTVIDNPLDIDGLEELLTRLPEIIKQAREKEFDKTKEALQKAEAKVNTIRLYLESLR